MIVLLYIEGWKIKPEWKNLLRIRVFEQSIKDMRV